MKLENIINYDLSYWNVLGQTGGTALPDNDKSVNVNGVEVWKKHPPFRTGKKKKRIDEYQRGPDYDWIHDKGAEQFQSGGDYDDSEFGGWTDSPETGDVIVITGANGRRKFTVKKVGKNTEEVVDDEGNRSLRGSTGNIGPGEHLGEVATGTGLGGTGATQHPTPGVGEPEYDLGRKHLKKEFKGKDSRADIKTNKDKRETLKKYLDRRSNNA